MRSPAMWNKLRSTKVRKTYNLIIQVVILGMTWGFIYDQVFYRKDLVHLLETLTETVSSGRFIPLLILVLLLMPVNWMLEAGKWQYLMQKIERIGFWTSFQAVLTGVTVSSFTPNRIGEYFGRIFILRSASRIEGILVTIVGSMGQLLITILSGSIALLVFIPVSLDGFRGYSPYLYYVVVAAITGLNVLLLGLYLNVSFLSALKEKILTNGLKRLRKFFRIFGFYHSRELLFVLLISLLRYGIFSTQFYLLLKMSGISLPYPDALMLISLTYFVMAIIPTIALTELGIRGSVALYFFGLYYATMGSSYDGMQLGVLSASTLLWAINLGVPALAGTFFVFRLRFFRKNRENGSE